MRIHSTFLFLLFYTCTLPAQHCDCALQFGFLTEKIAVNYAGYKDKVTAQTQKDFEVHTEKYKELTGKVTNDTTCLRLLREWTHWFKDHHVQLRENLPDPEPSEVRAMFTDWETLEIDEAGARLAADREGSAPVEGIWQDESGNYRVAIVRSATDRRDYAAVILKADSVWWMPGQVKFELSEKENGFSIRYFMRDHSERTSTASVSDHVLYVQGLGSWIKRYPEQGVLQKEEPAGRYRLEQPDGETLLLVVPTMNHNYRKELKKLIRKNKKLLKRTPNLIIDLRDNGGGSDITYRPLEKYVYTQPVTFDHMKTYATKDNADKYLQLAKDKNMPWISRKLYKKYGKELLKKEGQFVGKDGKGTFKKRRPLDHPEKVVLLINDGCGSSCEQFVLYARQSKKVTMIGEATGGVLDYGNLHTLTFPCEYFQLAYPTSRSNRVEMGEGIDNAGIAPDIGLDEQSVDWVDFAVKFLHEK